MMNTFTRNRKTLPVSIRLERKLKRQANGCLLWTGFIASSGYATISFGRHNEGKDYIHRVAYELAKGKIPEGLVIDHLCRNRACANPEHLEAVTQRENTLRGLIGTKTVCVNGHSLSGDNLYKDPKGIRQCRYCRKVAMTRYKQNNMDRITKT